MKKKIRFFSLIMSLIMIFTVIPMNGISAMAVSAEDFTEPTIFVDSKYSAANSTVSVDISIANNPGIAGATLTVKYDQYLTLTAAQNGEAFSKLSFTKPGTFANPSKFLWDSESGEATGDGTILTLTFDVSASAEPESNLSIELSSNTGDFYNEDMETVNLQLVNGDITVIDYTPGDVNDDGVINGKDVTLIRRHIVGGYNQTINESAANVNGDSTINGKDVTAIRRYIVGGYDIALRTCSRVCNHKMEATEYNAASCEADGNIAYWHCTACDKYFKDTNGTSEVSLDNTVIPATGHTVVIDPAVPATETSTGLTEGSHCSVCHKVILAREETSRLEAEQYSITYNVANGDLYLASLEIENLNPGSYISRNGLTLKNLSVPGYTFLGWYDLPAGSNAENVKMISVGAKGDIELYAHWEKIEYSVNFKSELVNADKITYTVDEGAVLPSLKLDGYIFAGWSDNSGKILKTIPVGTIGSKTYTANWVSERNQAWSKTKLDNPIVIEDDETNTILFTYEIGEIRNVPVYVIEDFGKINSNGVSKTVTKTFTTTTTKSLMDTYTNTVANETTNSYGWTLSDGWSDSTTVNEEWCKQNGMTTTEAEEHCNSDTSGWYVSSGSSGSSTTETLDTSDNYKLNTSTHNSSVGGGTSSTSSSSVSATVTDTSEVSASISSEVSAKYCGIGGKISASAEVSDTFSSTNSSSVYSSDSVNSTYNLSGGVSNQGGSITHTGTNTTSNSSWNSESGYNGSSTVSNSSSVSKAISENITNSYGYGKSYIKNGSTTSTQETTASSSSSDSYSSAVTYSTAESKSQTLTYTTTNTVSGYHRWTMASTAHVFAVVGYDIATKSYFVTTYTVMDDEAYQFEDYSYNTASYDDNQNTYIGFEVPYDNIVTYVGNRVGESDGLEVSSDGTITSYTGTDSYVVIPEYKVIDNLDGTSQVIKVTSMSSTAFCGKTNITGIVLSDFIDEIPENAFNGCTSLVEVGSCATKIGSNAFSKCTSIPDIRIGYGVKSIGANAFDSAINLTIYAANNEVVDAAVSSGADNITVHITDICDSLDGKTLNISDKTNSFIFNGLGKEYNNLVINSDAQNTTINRATFSSNGNPSLTISSPDVTLNQVTVHSQGIGAVFIADICNMALYGMVSVNSKSENALLCRHINLSQKDASFYSLLTVNGNMLVRKDEISYLKNSKYLNCNGEIKSVDEKAYQKYLAGTFEITLDTNCDNDSSVTLADERIKTYCNCEIGTLPELKRDYYVFDGWYTEKEGGTRITSESSFDTVENITIYAHWTQKAPSDWVVASSVPSDAQIVNTKWTYKLRSYTSSANSSLSGWTKYDTQRTSWGSTQGPVYSDPHNGERNVWESSYEKSRTHHWVYYRYANSSYSQGNDTEIGSYYNYQEVDLTYENDVTYMPGYGNSAVGYTGNRGVWCFWYDGSGTQHASTFWPAYEYDDIQTGTCWYYQDPVYTYYYYKDEAKETTSGDPTGTANVSNVVKYVQYRAK